MQRARGRLVVELAELVVSGQRRTHEKAARGEGGAAGEKPAAGQGGGHGRAAPYFQRVEPLVVKRAAHWPEGGAERAGGAGGAMRRLGRRVRPGLDQRQVVGPACLHQRIEAEVAGRTATGFGELARFGDTLVALRRHEVDVGDDVNGGGRRRPGSSRRGPGRQGKVRTLVVGRDQERRQGRAKFPARGRAGIVLSRLGARPLLDDGEVVGVARSARRRRTRAPPCSRAHRGGAPAGGARRRPGPARLRCR